MYELLTKNGFVRPFVIKKSAAIFLLITLMCIGSIPITAYAAEQGHTAGMIAATQPELSLLPFAVIPQQQSVTDILALPRLEQNTVPFPVPILDENLEPFNWKPEDILGETQESQAASRIPTISGMITSAFGWRKHPVRGKMRHHDGIDLAAKLGAPVFAPATGRVVFAGVRSGYGNVIEIDHENGYTTLLAHHSKLLVKVGDLVDPTTVIAKAGRTGIATGVHVHLEVRQNGSLINPKVFLSK